MPFISVVWGQFIINQGRAVAVSEHHDGQARDLFDARGQFRLVAHGVREQVAARRRYAESVAVRDAVRAMVVPHHGVPARHEVIRERVVPAHVLTHAVQYLHDRFRAFRFPIREYDVLAVPRSHAHMFHRLSPLTAATALRQPAFSSPMVWASPLGSNTRSTEWRSRTMSVPSYMPAPIPAR